MMNNIRLKLYKKMRMAAAGSLFLFVLLCGCADTGAGERILIGSATDRQEREVASEDETSPFLSGTAQGREQRTGNSEIGASNTESRASDTEASASHKEALGTEPPVVLIRVYVCGAVANPGVVEVPEGSRVEDVLLAAGGFRGEAAREAVNLAGWVEDGQMIYFPAEEELESLESGTGYGTGAESGLGLRSGYGMFSGQGASSGQVQKDSLVNINTADAAELCTLPGVGESRARDIIAYREKNGGFACCEDIMKVSGIKTNLYEKIREKITVR